MACCGGILGAPHLVPIKIEQQDYGIDYRNLQDKSYSNSIHMTVLLGIVRLEIRRERADADSKRAAGRGSRFPPILTTIPPINGAIEREKAACLYKTNNKMSPSCLSLWWRRVKGSV